jgi:predicted AAA+ superfamily ATPase
MWGRMWGRISKIQEILRVISKVLAEQNIGSREKLEFGDTTPVAILEQLDAVFRLSPFGPLKAIKKGQKLHFWDWMRAESEAARFENMVAMHLVRLVDWGRDVEGEKLEPRYFRSLMGHEVDFLLMRNRRPWLAIEARLAEQELDSGLRPYIEITDFRPGSLFLTISARLSI